MSKTVNIQNPISMSLIQWIIDDITIGLKDIPSRRLISVLIIKAIKYETLHRTRRCYNLDRTKPYYEIVDDGRLIKVHHLRPRPSIVIDSKYTNEFDEVKTYHILEYLRGE